jgi:hypothetical protein
LARVTADARNTWPSTLHVGRIGGWQTEIARASQVKAQQAKSPQRDDEKKRESDTNVTPFRSITGKRYRMP